MIELNQDYQRPLTWIDRCLSYSVKQLIWTSNKVIDLVSVFIWVYNITDIKMIINNWKSFHAWFKVFFIYDLPVLTPIHFSLNLKMPDQCLCPWCSLLYLILIILSSTLECSQNCFNFKTQINTQSIIHLTFIDTICNCNFCKYHLCFQPLFLWFVEIKEITDQKEADFSLNT